MGDGNIGTGSVASMAAFAGSQMKTSSARLLSQDEQDKLARQDSRIVPTFKQEKLEKEALKNWDIFYKRNTTKFFKDRHWTTREFQDLCGCKDYTEAMTVLEVGCGVGNFMWPLLIELPHAFFHACDFSPRAVQFVKEDERYSTDRCHAFQCDLTSDDLTQNVATHSVDIVTMIFVLSAIHPDKMVKSLKNISKVLHPGGCVLLRDYGLNDHAMLRFAPGSKLSENLYVRQDGTRSFFFSEDKLSSLFEEAGFHTTSLEYILRETVNRKESLCVPRVFIQGKFTLQTAEGATDKSCVTRDETQPSDMKVTGNDKPFNTAISQSTDNVTDKTHIS